MKKILNQLVQLQELDFVLAENKASSAKIPLDQLEKSIIQIQQQLPEEIGARYKRLHGRFPLAVVPMMRGTCPPCGIALPPAVVNAVKAADQVQTCPHCGRFLYLPEAVARQPRKPMSNDRPAAAGIAKFSAPALMVPKLAATTREEAIQELSVVMQTNGFIEDSATLAGLALRREAIISTAVEHGLAFPHARDVEGGGLTFAVGLKEKGLDFGASDEKLTKIIFLIAIPTPASAFYLRLLAGMVRAFSETAARKSLLECDTPEAMWKTLTKLTRETIP